jgi:hypothetical protein
MLTVPLSENASIMPTTIEKSEFSKRLELALRRNPETIQGATDLALQFNLRYQGESVSAQTTHKWLNGRAIPMNDKLEVLAKWLNVDLHWLHYGSPKIQKSPSAKDVSAKRKPTPENIELAARIQNLPPHNRYLIEELVSQLQQEIG